MPLAARTILQRLTTKARLRHLQALIVVNDLRSMGRAAQAMGMTQPAMSQTVAELERLLDARLFLRHSRGVDPTPAALDLLPIARRMMGAVEEGAERLAYRHNRDAGLVRVAATGAAIGSLLHRALPRHFENHPHIQVHVDEVTSHEQDAAFTGGEYDIVCCRARPAIPSGWTFQPCVKDEMVVVCGSGHPLAGRKHVTLEELGKAIWLQNQVSTIARVRFDELVERAQWTSVREVHVLAQVPTLVWAMLKENTMLVLVPRSVVQPWLDDGLLSVLPSDATLPMAALGCHWNEERTGTATRLFLEELFEMSDIAAAGSETTTAWRVPS